MRVLLVIGNRLVRQVLERHVKVYGLIASTTTLEEALAADDGPAVVLWAKRWTPAVAGVVRRLEERQAAPFVVCPAGIDPKTHLAILRAGARAAVAEDRDLLEALVFQVARLVRERGVLQWQLGHQVFDLPGGCLFDDGERIALSPVEVRLLRRLCVASAADPASRLTTRQLAEELGADDAPSASQESSVRNYIAKLRRLLEDDPEQPQVLRHDSGGYYVVLGIDTASTR